MRNGDAPIRILGLNTEPGWRGGENQCLLLHRGLRKCGDPGLAAAMACRGDQELFRRLRAEGLACHGLGAWRPHDPRAIRGLRRLLRAWRIDILHAHASHAHSLAVLAAHGLPTRVVVTRRVAFPVGGSVVDRLKYQRGCDVLVAISDGARQALRSGGLPLALVPVIHSGVDAERFQGADREAVRRELRLDGNQTLLVTVSALEEEKGVSVLVDALGRLTDASIHLALAGSGSCEGALRQQITDLGLQARVHLLGHRRDIPHVLAAGDLFVLPSLFEGLGTSLWDAMAAGLPVIASRTGGIPECVHDGRTGVLTPPGDPAALALAIRSLVDDPGCCRRLAENGRRFAYAYGDYRRMVSAYRRLYRCLGRARWDRR